jgi:hypothetical protein
MNNFYTYAYLREDRTPYYVGKGKGKRLYDRRKNDIKPPKDKTRVIFLKQNLTEEEAFKHEIYMIAVFGRKDLVTGILYNRTNGGQGCSGRFLSEEERLKISERMKGEGCYWYGKKHTNETKKRMSEAQSKRTHTEETKRKMSLSQKGKNKKPLSKEQKQKISSSLCKNRWMIELPNGEHLEVINLKQFCLENNLNVGHMSNRRKSKGYKVTKILEE